MYRAERLDGKGKVEGCGCAIDKEYSQSFVIKKDDINGMMLNIEIKPETLEIYLFGEWRLVSELEKKYKLVEV